MPNKKYCVELTEEQRSHLLERLGRGERPAAEQTRVRVLLKVDEGPDGPAWTDDRTAEALEVASGTVAGIRQRFCERGLTGCVERKSPDREYDRKLDGEQEAELIRLACSKAPEGRSERSLLPSIRQDSRARRRGHPQPRDGPANAPNRRFQTDSSLI